jgi:hypothetical protein
MLQPLSVARKKMSRVSRSNGSDQERLDPILGKDDGGERDALDDQVSAPHAA